MTAAHRLLPLILGTLIAGSASMAETIDELLASRALENSYNGVVVDFLVEEGAKKVSKKRRKQALDQHGTDDLDALRGKLEDMKAENERRRAAYQAELEKIEAALADAERDEESEE